MQKISIIIPIFNVEKYIRKCIDSVLAQTFSDFECILINDGSPDNSPIICDEYTQRDERIKVIHKTNGGVSSARNAGLDIAQGEWICFIDSDDWVNENYLELMYNNAVNNNCDLSICGLQSFDENYKPIRKCEQIPAKMFDKISAKKILLSPRYFSSFMVNKLVKRKHIQKNNIRFDIELKLDEDTLFWFEIIDKIDKVFYDSTPCYNYYKRKTSAVSAIDNRASAIISAKKMKQIETDKSVLKKIEIHNAVNAARTCSLLLKQDKFIKEKYVFYRNILLKKLFGCLVDSNIKLTEKIAIFSCLFPPIYRLLRNFRSFFTERKINE